MIVTNISRLITPTENYLKGSDIALIKLQVPVEVSSKYIFNLTLYDLGELISSVEISFKN